MGTTTTDKTFTGINNVVKLLPTTTLFAFQTLNPTFSNRGECLPANRYLSASLLFVCAVSCAFFSITDSIIHKGKLFFGVATFTGFYVFNFNETDSHDDKKWLKDYCKRKYRLKLTDGVHVVFTVVVFLAVTMSDANLQDCFFPSVGENGKQLLANLPLGFGFLASVVFMIMPHTRKGLGYSSDVPQAVSPVTELEEMEPL